MTALTFLMVAATLAFVAWPFFVPRREENWEETGTLSPLERQKVEALTALKEAEFDLRTGKLSDADFAALSDKYRQQAITAIAALEEKRRPSKAEKGAGREGAGRGGRAAYCPDCGHKAAPGAGFCGGCGRRLKGAAA